MQTFRDLIDSWPTIAEFSRDVGVGYEAARKMRDRNNIRNEYWEAVIDAAKQRGISVTPDDLYRMSLMRRRRSGARVPARVAA